MTVSIVTATKNPNKAYFAATIKSVLNQTFIDFEFIIVDDGSDCPVETFINGLTTDKRIKVFRIPNSGLGAALNYGISKSTGKYIARIDDDDMMMSSRIAKQVIFLDKNPRVSCVGTQLIEITEDFYRKHRHYPLIHDEIIDDMLSLKWAMAHTTLMFRREIFDIFGGYRISGGGQDVDLILQLGVYGNLANIDEYLSCYRISTTGLSVTNPNKYKAYLFAFNNLKESHQLENRANLIEKSISKLIKITQRKPHKNYLRAIMMLRIKLFGKRMANLNLNI